MKDDYKLSGQGSWLVVKCDLSPFTYDNDSLCQFIYLIVSKIQEHDGTNRINGKPTQADQRDTTHYNLRYTKTMQNSS